MTVTFTVGEVVLPNSIDLDKVTLYAPVGGTAQIVGEAGAVPAGELVWVENLTSYQTTESVTASQDGSFTLQVGAELSDEILFHVLVDGGNEVVKLLGPYMSPDRRGAWIGQKPATFRTVDGVTLITEAGTFDTFTEVRLEPKGLDQPPEAPWPAPDVLQPVYRFDLDFGGAEARRPINLRVPAPAGAQPEWYLLAKAWDFFGEPLWSMKNIMVLDGGELTTERSAAPPTSSQAADGGEAPALKSFGLASPATQASSLGGPSGPQKAASSDPRDYDVKLWASGNFSVFNSNALTFAVVTLDAAAVAFSDRVPGMVVEAIDALEYVAGLNQWAVPTLLGQEFTISAEDGRTGFELFRETFQPTTGPLQVLEPALFGDTGRPFLTGGDPVLLQTLAATPGSRDIKRGVRVEVSANRDGSGQLLDQQTLTVTFEQDSLVIDRRSDEASTPIPIQAKLTSLGDGTEVAKLIGPEVETGPVTLSRTVTLGESHLLSVGAVLRLDQWVEMEWNEALHPSLVGKSRGSSPPSSWILKPSRDGWRASFHSISTHWSRRRTAPTE
ncbi:MAG: hypothetical protein AAFY88_18590, partial [Acidobacteriota bacterium]